MTPAGEIRRAAPPFAVSLLLHLLLAALVGRYLLTEPVRHAELPAIAVVPVILEGAAPALGLPAKGNDQAAPSRRDAKAMATPGVQAPSPAPPAKATPLKSEPAKSAPVNVTPPPPVVRQQVPPVAVPHPPQPAARAVPEARPAVDHAPSSPVTREAAPQRTMSMPGGGAGVSAATREEGGGRGKGTGSSSTAGSTGGSTTGTSARSGSGSGKSGSGTAARSTYQGMLKSLIEKHKKYPTAARRAGREGSCKRALTLRRDGSLKKVEDVSSCGHPFLDEAATRAITSVEKFPPFPEEIAGAEQTFTVVITFQEARP